MTNTCGHHAIHKTPDVAKQGSFNGSVEGAAGSLKRNQHKTAKLNGAFSGGGKSVGKQTYMTQDATCKNGYFKMFAHTNKGAAEALHNHSVMNQFIAKGGGGHKRSRHKRSRHKRSRHKRSRHKRSLHKRSRHKRSRHKRSLHKRSRHKRSLHKRSLHKRSLHKRSRHKRSRHK